MKISPNCPRCGSSNTKFCYYNNYSLTQPRYFCKGCRRYWTKGGSLRNVPVSGGCRKNRRCKSLRLPSTDGDVHLIRHPCASSDETNSSSTVSGGSRIDLALVYANFLSNQQQENKGFEFDPYVEFSRLSNTNVVSSIQLQEENDLIENYACALPPLPGYDLSSQEILWSNSNCQSSASMTLQATGEPVLERETHDSNQVFGNWNPFDLYS